MVELKCMGDGYISDYEGEPWHTGSWPACTAVASKKKRRRRRSSSLRQKRAAVEYTGLHEDIDYTILVLMETQFKYTDAIASEVAAAYGVSSKEDPVRGVEVLPIKAKVSYFPELLLLLLANRRTRKAWS